LPVILDIVFEFIVNFPILDEARFSAQQEAADSDITIYEKVSLAVLNSILSD
jgi:hypothetical protein